MIRFALKAKVSIRPERVLIMFSLVFMPICVDNSLNVKSALGALVEHKVSLYHCGHQFLYNKKRH